MVFGAWPWRSVDGVVGDPQLELRGLLGVWVGGCLCERATGIRACWASRAGRADSQDHSSGSGADP